MSHTLILGKGFVGTKLKNYFDNIDFKSTLIGKSDIDIAIITDNVESVKKKLQNYLNIGKSKIKKSMQKIKRSKFLNNS